MVVGQSPFATPPGQLVQTGDLFARTVPAALLRTATCKGAPRAGQRSCTLACADSSARHTSRTLIVDMYDKLRLGRQQLRHLIPDPTLTCRNPATLCGNPRPCDSTLARVPTLDTRPFSPGRSPTSALSARRGRRLSARTCACPPPSRSAPRTGLGHGCERSSGLSDNYSKG